MEMYCSSKGSSFDSYEGGSSGRSPPVRIQRSARSRDHDREELEERQSFETLQHQYELATWRMQDRILRYREQHQTKQQNQPSSAAGNESNSCEHDETQFEYYGPDEESSQGIIFPPVKAQPNEQDETQLVNEHKHPYPEIFEMDL